MKPMMSRRMWVVAFVIEEPGTQGDTEHPSRCRSPKRKRVVVAVGRSCSEVGYISNGEIAVSAAAADQADAIEVIVP